DRNAGPWGFVGDPGPHLHDRVVRDEGKAAIRRRSPAGGARSRPPRHPMIAEAIPRVIEVEAPADLEAVRLLLMSHAAALRGHLGSGALLTDAMRLPGPYVPVLGRLYLARLEGSAAGCVGLRPLGPTVGEVKRLYVVHAARRLRVAGALMKRLLSDARPIGHDPMA